MVNRLAASPLNEMTTSPSIFDLPERKMPLMLGVVGDSGSGKSTLVQGFYHIFKDYHVTEICLDDYHRYDRTERKQRKITALHPAANKLALMTTHLEALRRGQTIEKPVYNHATGTFDKPVRVTPGEVVIVHGLFTLFSPALSQLFDLSIYLDPEPGLRVAWKIKRDTQKRGYSLAEVLQQIEERRQDVATYIAPQKASADMIIRFGRPPQMADYSTLKAELIWQNNVHLAKAFDQATNFPYLHFLPTLKGGKLTISDKIDAVNTLYLANKLTGDLPPVTLAALGQYHNGTGLRQSYTLLLTQVILAQQILKLRPDFFSAVVAKLGA